mmetsp:Transcript_18692/g.30986  ORF Transcript_18692/g.30986 Transcript_18692/m.30986 type:complete len:131 (-) Transcript_18692:109-501(-)
MEINFSSCPRVIFAEAPSSTFVCHLIWWIRLLNWMNNNSNSLKREVVEEAEVVAVGADVVEDAVVDEEEEAGVEAVVEVEMAVGEMVVGEVEMEVEEMAVGEVEEAREAEVAEVEGAEEEIPATKVRPNQ